MDLGTLATNIYDNEFEGVSGAPNIISISGWLSGHIGDLNNLIYSDLSPTGDFPNEEASIFQALYLSQYYRRQSVAVLKGVGITANDWTSIREGDTTISRTNRSEMAKTYSSLSMDQVKLMNNMIANYQIYKSAPVQVAGEDSLYPAPTNQTYTTRRYYDY